MIETIFKKSSLQEGRKIDSRIIYPNGELYIGKLQACKRVGKGKYISRDGSVFEGDFIEDVKEGEGSVEMKDGTTFKATFKNDEFQKVTDLVDGKGNQYFLKKGGEFIKGKLHSYQGEGSVTFVNGDVYTGSFKSG